MTKQSKAKVTKAQMVLAIVSRTPECVLQDVCDALDLQASTAGNLLRQLHAAGKLHRTHNGCQYVYRVVAGVEVPDVALPQTATPLSEEDVKKSRTHCPWRRRWKTESCGAGLRLFTHRRLGWLQQQTNSGCLPKCVTAACAMRRGADYTLNRINSSWYGMSKLSLIIPG